MNKIIEMKQIDKFYQVGSSQLHAIKQVSLTVEKGSFWQFWVHPVLVRVR